MTTALAEEILPAPPALRLIEGEGIAEGRLDWVRRVPRGLAVTAMAVLVYGEWDGAQRVSNPASSTSSVPVR